MMFRVTDLDRSIKYYTECLGMKHLRSRDNEKARRPPGSVCGGLMVVHFFLLLPVGALGYLAIPLRSSAWVLRHCEGCT